MAREEIHITGIVAADPVGECIRVELASGKKRFVLWGSVSAAVEATELIRLAVQRRTSAKVVALPKHG